jgi:cytochrome d ubiquinol oxidase subunit II
MSLELVMGGVILVSLIIYVLLGGADYGAGVWSLLASGPRKSEQRELVDDAIGPIWEANHVWLILVIVVLFTAFPPAFAVVTTRLHIPLTIMLIGVVLRGASFAFQNPGYPTGRRTVFFWGKTFAVSSLITPVFLGITLGAIASGGIREGEHGFLERFVWDWFAPFPLAVGVFALVLFAYLAAIYLTLEAESPECREDFRRRAFRAGIAVIVMSVIVFLLLKGGAPEIRQGLTGTFWGRILLLATLILSLAALYELWKGHFGAARVYAVAQVGMILSGWAFAQFPYLVGPELTLYNSAAPEYTLQWLLLALTLGAFLLFPSLFYLYRVFKRREVLRPPLHKSG